MTNRESAMNDLEDALRSDMAEALAGGLNVFDVSAVAFAQVMGMLRTLESEEAAVTWIDLMASQYRGEATGNAEPPSMVQ